MEKMKPHWSLQLHDAKFFVTGGSQMQYALDLNYIPVKGINLAGAGQTLQESYSIAAQVFENVTPGTIKFVLIEVKPYKILDDSAECKFLSDDEIKEFSQTLKDYCKLCFDNGARPVIMTFPAGQTLKQNLSANALENFYSAIKQAGKDYKYAFINLINLARFDKFLYDESSLQSNGAAIFTALFSSMLYINNVISVKKICDMPADYFDLLSKNFADDYKKFIPYVFCKTACDDFKRLSQTMPKGDLMDLMAHVFSAMTYTYLFDLSDMLPADDYNDVAARIFAISAEKIRRKDKIKIGFVLYDSSMWSGDDLYNLFAQDERFEPTIFLCLRSDQRNKETVKKDFLHGVEQFKKSGLNVTPVLEKKTKIPRQDILMFLTPYFSVLPKDFNPQNTSLESLIMYIPYALSVSRFRKFNDIIFCSGWKIFLQSIDILEDYRANCKVGLPRGLYSGYPRMDFFFEQNADFKFDWKMTRPDAKKIIWAPHWSILNAVKYATFQWNYKFMYEFAKAHPEISWVVKPHPNLLFSAVKSGIFPSIEAFEEYMQKWDDLPNAQVYTGAYYQAIFATSDGMIHDSGSFIAEYQYVDKPMIYLTRKTQKFNELGNAILDASYCVGGKNFNAIAAMIQRVFIEGDDYKAAKRRSVFDKYLNYPKANGMLASEFIYKSIADEVTASK